MKHPFIPESEDNEVNIDSGLPLAESFGAQVAWLVHAGANPSPSSAALTPTERDALDDHVVLLSQILRVSCLLIRCFF